MPIPEELKPFLEGISAADVAVFDNLLTKTPGLGTRLKEGVLRQSDYDRKMNENKTKLTAAEERAKELDEWYEVNNTIHTNLLTEYDKLEKQSRELQEKLARAEAARTASGGDDNVNAAELEARVKEEVSKLGYVSKSEMDSIIATQANKLATEAANAEIKKATDQFWKETFPAAASAQADIAEICYDHKVEFNENIDRAALDAVMKERGLTSFKKGYEALVEPKRKEREFTRKVDDEVKTRLSGMTGGGFAGGSPILEKGAVQMRIEREAAKAAASGVSSSKLAAVEAAQELRNEGKM
jgi:hypothetical protein